MAISLGIAVSIVAVPLIWLRLTNGMGPIIYFSWPLSIFWAFQIRWAAEHDGKRRFWALVGLPFLLWWPFFLICYPRELRLLARLPVTEASN
jgi:hypothetical protein